MEFLDLLKGRRSIRQYHSREVEKEKIDTILEAAQWAPSASNKQPWHFIVIQDKATRKRLGQIHSHGRFMEEAPVVIVVLGNPEAHPKYYLCDPHQAVQNILLTAFWLGLGSCWMGVRGAPFENEIKELLEVPQGLTVICTVSIGYSDQKRESTRYPLSELVSWESYGKTD
ncbi:MAG: nitroreductase family protein [Candidatus Thorarchaeota archaeon]